VIVILKARTELILKLVDNVKGNCDDQLYVLNSRF